MCQIQKQNKIMKFQIYRKFVHIIGPGGGGVFIRNRISFKKNKIKIKMFEKRKGIVHSNFLHTFSPVK